MDGGPVDITATICGDTVFTIDEAEAETGLLREDVLLSRTWTILDATVVLAESRDDDDPDPVTTRVEVAFSPLTAYADEVLDGSACAPSLAAAGTVSVTAAALDLDLSFPGTLAVDPNGPIQVGFHQPAPDDLPIDGPEPYADTTWVAFRADLPITLDRLTAGGLQAEYMTLSEQSPDAAIGASYVYFEF